MTVSEATTDEVERGVENVDGDRSSAGDEDAIEDESIEDESIDEGTDDEATDGEVTHDEPIEDESTNAEGATDGAAFVRYLKDRAGRHLRAVLSYDAGGWDVLFARKDVRQTEFALLYGEMEMQVRSRPGTDRSSSEGGPRLRSTISCYDRGVVVHLPLYDRRVVVLLDRRAAPRLQSFAAECIDRLETSSTDGPSTDEI